MSERPENVVVNEGTLDQEFTVDNSGTNVAANEDLVNVKTFKSCFSEKIDSDMGNIVDTAEERIQNAFFTAITSILTPKMDKAIRSINAYSAQDATSVIVNSEQREHLGITALSKTYPTRMAHYMCLIRMIRFESIFRTR